MKECDEITIFTKQPFPKDLREQEVESLVLQKRNLLSQLDELNGRLVAVLKESKFLTNLGTNLSRLSMEDWPLLNALNEFAQTKKWAGTSSSERNSVRENLVALKVRNRVLELERQELEHSRKQERQQFIKDMAKMKRELVAAKSSRSNNKRRFSSNVMDVRGRRSLLHEGHLSDDEQWSGSISQIQKKLEILKSKLQTEELNSAELGSMLETSRAQERKLKVMLEKSRMKSESLILLLKKLKAENVHLRSVKEGEVSGDTAASVEGIDTKFERKLLFLEVQRLRKLLEKRTPTSDAK